MGRRHGRPNGGDPGSGLALSNHCQTEPDHRRQGRQDGCSYNCEQKIIAIGLAQTGIRLAELWSVFSYSNTILGEVSERALRRYGDLGSKAFETKSYCSGQHCTLRMSAHHVPVFGIDTQGSLGAIASPFCKSSTETRSGERTNAMCPSRGGRLIVTPKVWSLAQVA